MVNKTTHKVVTLWLLTGCIMVLVQIIIGGITRLTDSGLSITEWSVIKGTLPPLNDTEWIESFEKYKTFAKKQFESIHKEMTLQEFKRIYFWEYFHRLWARWMGFVFVIPFVIFVWKGKINSKLIKKLGVVILLASLSAIFGWLMVASGLNDDKRTWVNAYNLLIHLILATSLFSYLVYTIYDYSLAHFRASEEVYSYSWLRAIGVLLIIQIGLGAMMAGMKAALVFPYPFILFKLQNAADIWQSSAGLHWEHWLDYEPNPKVKLVVQIFHRATAYFLALSSIWFFMRNRILILGKPSFSLYYILLLIQIVLGIYTVTYSIGNIPVTLGVLHQLTAFLLLAAYLWIVYSVREKK